VGIEIKIVVTNHQSLLSSVILRWFGKSIFKRKYGILACNFPIKGRRAERKEINLLKNLIAILLINIYNNVRNSEHISIITNI